MHYGFVIEGLHIIHHFFLVRRILLKSLKLGFAFVFVFLFSSCNYENEINAIKSIKTLDDGVFYIEFFGDYDFERFIAQGVNKKDEESADFLIESLLKVIGSTKAFGAFSKGSSPFGRKNYRTSLMQKIFLCDIFKL
jgi:hypothetical protein